MSHPDANLAETFLRATFTNRRTVPPGKAPPALAVRYPVNVATVYAGPLECELAIQTHVTLLHALEEPCDIQSHWWTISSLGERNSLAAAAHTAVEAQLIIVAISDAFGLPPRLTEWIDRWLPEKRNRDSGLVVLIRKVSPQAETAAFIREHFRRVAKTAGMPFFVSELSRNEGASVPPLAGPRRVHRGCDGTPRWGINE